MLASMFIPWYRPFLIETVEGIKKVLFAQCNEMLFTGLADRESILDLRIGALMRA